MESKPRGELRPDQVKEFAIKDSLWFQKGDIVPFAGFLQCLDVESAGVGVTCSGADLVVSAGVPMTLPWSIAEVVVGGTAAIDIMRKAETRHFGKSNDSRIRIYTDG